MTLIGTLLYSSISIILFGAVLQGLHLFAYANKNIMLQFNQQQSELLFRYYFKHDIYNAGFQGCMLQRPDHLPRINSCKPSQKDCSKLVDSTVLNLINNNELNRDADILILHNVATTPLPICDYMNDDANVALGNTIFYYLKKSVINNSYALYRVVLPQQSVALVENLRDMQIEITEHGAAQLIHVVMTFTNGELNKFVFSTRNGNET